MMCALCEKPKKRDSPRAPLVPRFAYRDTSVAVGHGLGTVPVFRPAAGFSWETVGGTQLVRVAGALAVEVFHAERIG